jgi:hypothetical protein
LYTYIGNDYIGLLVKSHHWYNQGRDKPVLILLDAIVQLFDVITFIGPSGVRALPLAAGINEGGPYFR